MKSYNLNFHWRWRWWDRIQAIVLNLFYFNWPGSRYGQYIVRKTVLVKTWIYICTEINQWLKLIFRNKSSAGNSTIVKSQFSSWYPKVSLCKWAIQIVEYSIFWLSCHICRAGLAEYVLFWVCSTHLCYPFSLNSSVNEYFDEYGPHFFHWKVNLGSWITWYISEIETN